MVHVFTKRSDTLIPPRRVRTSYYTGPDILQFHAEKVSHATWNNANSGS